MFKIVTDKGKKGSRDSTAGGKEGIGGTPILTVSEMAKNELERLGPVKNVLRQQSILSTSCRIYL